ncbi:hypothetical protein D9758_003373 [Tetrapyrgos nigripes]|uniref:Protein kinase domain-containing protein n=1 Tax=Tetrapyrgos nigripes TaxID=182062 RepID=A0A8H5GV60_9AGAR|nr:hypothetical protein D9758_003373 [Tetrapyrgos nigripes]
MSGSQALFAHSHGISFHNSSIVAVAGNQINYAEEAGLRRLYETVANVGALHDSEARYPPPKCHPATRQAVLARLSNWIIGLPVDSVDESSMSPATSVHWLYGQAGMGKSAVAQTLAERFDGSQGSRYLAASFFFSRSNPARSSPASFVTTISLCLAIWTGNSSLRAAIDEVVRTNPTILGASVETQFRELVVKPLLRLSPEETLELPKVVIIDGLDECLGTDSQRRILTTIFHALGSGTTNTRQSRFPLRFLIASRPEIAIRDVFNNHNDVTARTELGNNHQAYEDIARYLRDEFARIYDNHRLTMVDVQLPWPSRGVIDNIVQRASGQFIYAKTVLKYVDDEFSTPLERLELVMDLPVGDPDALAELDALYHQILSVNPNTNRLVLVLGAVLAIVKEDRNQRLFHSLDHLLSLPAGSVLSTLRGMHSVLDITEEGIRVSHKSFEDFLKDRRRSREYFIDVDAYRDGLMQKARQIVTAYQIELSNPNLDSLRRTECLRYIFAFAKNFAVLPASFLVNRLDLHVDDPYFPFAGGRSADFYRGIANGQQVCFKVLRTYAQRTQSEYAGLSSDFCYEMSIWRQLQHPNILPFVGVDFHLFPGRRFCAISPWMSNGNLSSFLHDHPEQDRIQCIIQIAEGMNYLHSLRPTIAHGDIKGVNILVSNDLRCCLCDFGLAMEYQIADPGTDETRGSVRWLAPEFLDITVNGQDMLARDVFAFACTAFEISSGRIPRDNCTSDAQVIFELQNERRPSRPNTGWCTDAIWALIEHGWAQDPTSRPRSQEIRDYLRQLG